MRSSRILALSWVIALAVGAATAAAATHRPLQEAGFGAQVAANRQTAQPDPSAPEVVFQAVGQNGDLAIVSASQLLSAAVRLRPDNAFNADYLTGLAQSPTTHAIYVIGVAEVDSSSYLGTLDWSSGQVTTIGKLTGIVVNEIACDSAGNLYALTDDQDGSNPHTLLRVDTTTAAAQPVLVLNTHGAGTDGGTFGVIAYNPSDGNLYYEDTDSNDFTFVDRISLPGFVQTNVLQSTTLSATMTAMSFTQGLLWATDSYNWYTADPNNLAGGFTQLSTHPAFPSADIGNTYEPVGIIPSTLPCTPSATTACLYGRFQITVNYNAAPANGQGAGKVVLESNETVKFTFFDPSNIELVLKVLDGCSLGGHWWVFAGGLTDVGVAITITDTKTGALRTYTNKKGVFFQGFADTSAFVCP